MSSGYKTIELDSKKISSKDKKAIEEINSIITRDDFFIEINKTKVTANLNKLDFNDFKKQINNIIELNKLEKKNTLSEILNKIETIKSYGLKSGKRIYIDYNKERKVVDRKQKVSNRKSIVNKKVSLSKDNPYPSELKNKIICGDSEEVLAKIPDNSVDLIFTSPPYNFGLEYHSTQDDLAWDQYYQKLFKIFDQCIRILKSGGRLIVNVQPLFSDYIPSHHIISKTLMDKGLLWKGEILWEKNNYNCKYTAWGSWKSPSSPYLKYTWEFIEIFSKDSLKKNGSSENADITADEFKKWVVAKWSVAPERKMKQFGHPAMFPEEIAKRVIKLFSFKGDLVIDPFNGAGTTTLVAKNLGRDYLGIDVSNKYCRTAKERLK